MGEGGGNFAGVQLAVRGHTAIPNFVLSTCLEKGSALLITHLSYSKPHSLRVTCSKFFVMGVRWNEMLASKSTPQPRTGGSPLLICPAAGPWCVCDVAGRPPPLRQLLQEAIHVEWRKCNIGSRKFNFKIQWEMLEWTTSWIILTVSDALDDLFFPLFIFLFLTSASAFEGIVAEFQKRTYSSIHHEAI